MARADKIDSRVSLPPLDSPPHVPPPLLYICPLFLFLELEEQGKHHASMLHLSLTQKYT